MFLFQTRYLWITCCTVAAVAIVTAFFIGRESKPTEVFKIEYLDQNSQVKLPGKYRVIAVMPPSSFQTGMIIISHQSVEPAIYRVGHYGMKLEKIFDLEPNADYHNLAMWSQLSEQIRDEIVESTRCKEYGDCPNSWFVQLFTDDHPQGVELPWLQ